MNISNGTTFYVDTAYSGVPSQDYVKSQTLVSWIIVTALAANANIVLGDVAPGGPNKFNLSVPVAHSSQMFHFRGMNAMFPNGIRVLSLSNATATIGITNTGN
jgi:hypothetical protein